MRSKPERPWLKTGPGMGALRALTLLLATGPMARFTSGGRLASYGGGVASQRLRQGKGKGQGNTQHGHTSRGWAFVEAAPLAMRFAPGLKRFSQRQQAKSPKLVALKTVAPQ